MSTHFDSLDYLQQGPARQRAAYVTLTSHRVMEVLKAYDPILVGTVPIGIDLESSDLDVICCFADRQAFLEAVTAGFQHAAGFSIRTHMHQGTWSVIANFRLDDFDIEVFGQAIPTRRQLGYRHMLVEHRLLLQHGESFRQNILALKRQGLKTEPAFAVALGLEGDPYMALLQYEEVPGP
jgi:Domain of unknown function (DUF4269)